MRQKFSMTPQATQNLYQKHSKTQLQLHKKHKIDHQQPQQKKFYVKIDYVQTNKIATA